MAIFEKNNKNDENTGNLDANSSGSSSEFPAYDSYLSKLWQYDVEEPSMGMRAKDDLEALFYAKEFNFMRGSYQAGELAYMANFTERLLQSFIQSRITEEEQLKQEQRERTQEEQNSFAQREELYKVTVNRRNLVLADLASWFVDIPYFYYFESKVTKRPFMDAQGRTFLFYDMRAIEKAQARDYSKTEFELKQMHKSELADLLFDNGIEHIYFNEGSIGFTADRSILLPSASDKLELDEKEKAKSRNNRALRQHILLFMQFLHWPIPEDNKDIIEGKNKVLQQLEAHIGPKLLNGVMDFKIKNADGDNTSFIVLTDGKDSEAIACYTDKKYIPDDEYEHKEMAFFGVAHALLQDSNKRIQGIILDPGNLNFFFNLEWLKRLVSFAEYMQKRAQEQKQNTKD